VYRVATTAAVLVSQAEAIVRSLTNMAAVRTFTKTEPVSKQSYNAAMFVGEASRRLQRLLLF